MYYSSVYIKIAQKDALEDDLRITSVGENVLPFKIDSDITKLPNLNEYDIDEQLPSTIDSRYFSLSLHCDELISLMVSLNRSIDVIAVSEIWDSKKSPIVTNININGYSVFKSSSISQCGGVGLYVKSSLVASPRNDLDTVTENFETVWIEVDNKNGTNFLFCCV